MTNGVYHHGKQPHGQQLPGKKRGVKKAPKKVPANSVSRAWIKSVIEGKKPAVN
jgi:hypothetical protein